MGSKMLRINTGIKKYAKVKIISSWRVSAICAIDTAKNEGKE